MEKPRVCHICNKSFANGKAMGGHMRSHLAKLPVPTKTELENSPTLLITAVRSPSSNFTNDTSSVNPNPNRQVQSFRSVNNEAAPSHGKAPDLDRQSENGSLRNPTRKRSERQQRKTVVESQSVSSVIPETTLSDEEVALCLLMLLKDKWPKEGKPDIKSILNDDEEYEESEEEGEDDDGDDDDEDLSFSMSGASKSKDKYYKCDTCNKVFRSYQALGGHRASHRNKRIKIGLKEDREDADQNGFVDHRSFECPFCDKVFDSGQGLGGHKKVHFSYLGISKIDKSQPKKLRRTFLDLNLPAPMEEEDEGERVATQFSVLSNA